MTSSTTSFLLCKSSAMANRTDIDSRNIYAVDTTIFRIATRILNGIL